MDPWKIIDCPKMDNGCRVRFSDEDFSSDKRDSVYYVRTIEEPKLELMLEILDVTLTNKETVKKI